MLEAGPTRLRPILMTSTTIALALLPTAMQLGEGSELRAPLAAGVLGGVISSTLLTLMLIPVVYSLIATSSPRSRACPAGARSAAARRPSAGTASAGRRRARPPAQRRRRRRPRRHGPARSDKSPSASGSRQAGAH